jgi:hypothetical protein
MNAGASSNFKGDDKQQTVATLVAGTEQTPYKADGAVPS